MMKNTILCTLCINAEFGIYVCYFSPDSHNFVLRCNIKNYFTCILILLVEVLKSNTLCFNFKMDLSPGCLVEYNVYLFFHCLSAVFPLGMLYLVEGQISVNLPADSNYRPD